MKILVSLTFFIHTFVNLIYYKKQVQTHYLSLHELNIQFQIVIQLMA